MSRVNPVRKRSQSSDSESSSDDENAVGFKRLKRSEKNTQTLTKVTTTRSESASANGGLQKFRNGASASNGSETESIGAARTLLFNGTKDQVNGHGSSQPSTNEIMTVMGFEKGRGLAKYMEPMKKLGSALSLEDFNENVDKLGVLPEEVEFKSLTVVRVEEDVKWIPDKDKPMNSMDFEELISWRKIGPQKTSTNLDCDINNEFGFVDTGVFKELIQCKKLYQNMDKTLYQNVRAKANLFEKVGKGSFICRAAMKMANLDAVLEFELTQPKSLGVCHPGAPNNIFYFADICAGPGGFTEYILWRKKWEAKGFGMTIKGDLDFDLKNCVSAEIQTFDPYYGPANDGNIYNPENVSGFIQKVLSETGGKGVHLLMADGGFTVAKEEYLQEVLSGQIILSQCLVALGAVQVGGQFVCKLFDVFTPFTVALVFFMYMSFDLVSIHKPNTSRPANSERYLICKSKKARTSTEAVLLYLVDCHKCLWEFSKNPKDDKGILELLPLSIIADKSSPFYTYIKETNNRLARSQIRTLKQMIVFVREPSLSNDQQSEAVQKALEYWKVPEVIKSPYKLNSLEKECKEMLDSLPITMLKHKEKELLPTTLEAFFRSPYDWRVVVVEDFRGGTNRGFYLSMGRNKVFRYEGSLWVMDHLVSNFELPAKTLLYGEFANEIHGRTPGQQQLLNSFHIIDGLILGGVDIRAFHYTNRLQYCANFAKAMTKSSTLPIRVKTPVRMENITTVIQRLEHRVVKGMGKGAQLVSLMDCNDPSSPAIIPKGLLFLKITKDPWQMALSRSAMTKYWFNTVSGVTSANVPQDAISGFFHTMSNRVFWSWDKDTNVLLSRVEDGDPRISQMSQYRVHACTMVSYVGYSLRVPPRILSPLKSTPAAPSKHD